MQEVFRAIGRLSQSSVTEAIKELESDLGVELFGHETKRSGGS